MIRFLGYGLLLASVIWGMLNILQHNRLEQRSPYDEHTHFDYWYKVRHEHRIPAVYEPIRREALEIWACQSRYRLLAVSCAPDGRLTGPDPKVENTASPYLPTYYLATALVSEVVDLFPHTWDEFQLAKVSSMTWGLLSLCFMAVLSLQLGIPPAVGAMLLFASAQTPSFVYLSTTLNPEVFVLLGTVAGLWIHLRTADRFRNQWRWVAAMAALSACILTVKPTAMLLPVCIAVLEFAHGTSPKRQQFLRATTYLFGTLAVYVAIGSLTNQFRDVFQSDGVMRDYIVQRIGGRTFGTNMEMVFYQFQYSITSPGWRALVDWNLPHVFMWLPKYVQMTALLLLAHAGWTLISGQRIGEHAALHAGALAGCLALPLALFVYLKLADFPFFFQSRYYLPYLMVSSMTATAFICSALPTWFRFAKQRLTGNRDASTLAPPRDQHP